MTHNKVYKQDSKVVRLPVQDQYNEIKTKVIAAINRYSNIENWDSCDTFYFTELREHTPNKLVIQLVVL